MSTQQLLRCSNCGREVKYLSKLYPGLCLECASTEINRKNGAPERSPPRKHRRRWRLD